MFVQYDTDLQTVYRSVIAKLTYVSSSSAWCGFTRATDSMRSSDEASVVA